MWFLRVGWGWNIEKLLEDFSWNNSEFCAWIKRVLRIEIYQRPKQGTYVIRFVATDEPWQFQQTKIWNSAKSCIFNAFLCVYIYIYVDLIYTLISPKKTAKHFPPKFAPFWEFGFENPQKLFKGHATIAIPCGGMKVIHWYPYPWQGEMAKPGTRKTLVSGKSRGRLVTFWNLLIFENFALSYWIIKGKMPIVWVSGEFLVLQKMLMNFRNT